MSVDWTVFSLESLSTWCTREKERTCEYASYIYTREAVISARFASYQDRRSGKLRIASHQEEMATGFWKFLTCSFVNRPEIFWENYTAYFQIIWRELKVFSRENRYANDFPLNVLFSNEKLLALKCFSFFWNGTSKHRSVRSTSIRKSMQAFWGKKKLRDAFVTIRNGEGKPHNVGAVHFLVQSIQASILNTMR